jgi:hypothetical protein
MPLARGLCIRKPSSDLKATQAISRHLKYLPDYRRGLLVDNQLMLVMFAFGITVWCFSCAMFAILCAGTP